MIDKIVKSRDIRGDDCSVISAPLYHKNALAVKSASVGRGRIVLFSRFDASEQHTGNRALPSYDADWCADYVCPDPSGRGLVESNRSFLSKELFDGIGTGV